MSSNHRSIDKIKDLGKEFPISNVLKEIIGENSHDKRIDNFLIKHLRGVPRSHIYRCLRSGQVRINGKRIKADYRLQKGDLIRIPPIMKENVEPTIKIPNSKFMSFDILFHDESLLVINKPTGVAVHGGSNISFGVIEQLRAQHPNWKFLELVHRLDRDTSGSLLLAKKRAALIEVHRQIREREIKKHYLVLVKGKWQNQKQNVKLPLNKYITASGEKRVAVAINKNNFSKNIIAHTVFTLKKNWNNFSLLEAELITGRTHQIRVHLSYLGFPIAGDDKYGDFKLNKELSKTNKKGPKLKRMFLHASSVTFRHPTTNKILCLDAPLANDLQKFLNDLDTEI